jgi:hypothetical protein
MKNLSILIIFLVFLILSKDRVYFLSTQVNKTHTNDYYIHQAYLYFDFLDTSKPFIPLNYADKCVRYEWSPWGSPLSGVTGLGKLMHFFDKIYRFIYPCVIKNRTFQTYDINPFVRSTVTFHEMNAPYKTYDIYEEFSFNEKGEIIFIEAWTPRTNHEYNDRLSTKIPYFWF